MTRHLAILAATAPTFLSLLMIHSYGGFGYERPQPDPLRLAIGTAHGYATAYLPVLLAFLALWVPRWLPRAGATAAAVALALTVASLAVFGTGGFGPQFGAVLACQAVAVVAFLRTRPERRAPWPRAVIWSAVVLLALVQTLARNTPSSDVGCYADTKGTWALAFYHLDTAHGLYCWVAAAAIGAVLFAYRAAPLCGLVLLVPALFEPAAWLLSDAPHNCSSALELVDGPYLLAAVLAVSSRTRLLDRS
ncbi:hypothetical protein ACGF0J_08980 [Nonomuraea sp. NPDC047897]|uniref:hypothetical protein n=1 Tax=Nonomuraea sp. NPDC047897 TaxID=3364346 RepID=UPI003716B38B